LVVIKGEEPMARPTTFPWKPDPEFWSATRAEHTVVHGYELVAFDLPPTPKDERRIIGWELFTGPDLGELMAKGDAGSFEAAKAAAEAASFMRPETNSSDTRH
jgi:hypothetical protein